jgi:hypothetical protein
LKYEKEISEVEKHHMIVNMFVATMEEDEMVVVVINFPNNDG